MSPDGTLYGFLSNYVLTPNGLPGLTGLPWQESMINHNVSKASALYGDVIWHLTDRLNLTTGVRFTRDEREFSWYNPVRTADVLDSVLSGLQAGGFFDIPGVPPIEALQYPLATPGTNGNVEFNTLASTAAPLVVNNSRSDTSPRVVLDYKLTPETMVYGSATKGPPLAAGGYNFRPARLALRAGNRAQLRGRHQELPARLPPHGQCLGILLPFFQPAVALTGVER